MINEAACDWLMDHADISIRTQVARDLLKETKTAQDLSKELIHSSEVQKWLAFLRPQNPPQTFYMEHGAANYHLENALPKLLFLGVDGSFSEVREAAKFYIERMKEPDAYGSYFGAVNHPANRYRSGNRFYTILTANMLSAAGIRTVETEAFLMGSLNEMSQFAARKMYDIYLTEEERRNLKRVPRCWREQTYFIRPEITREFGFSYPLIYDMIGMQSLYGRPDLELRTQISQVLEYVMNDEFHEKIADGYGILVEENGSYHAMGWTPKFPGWLTLPSEEKLYASELLFFLWFASRYQEVKESVWYQKVLLLLEQYRTPEGRYCFPATWLKEATGYAVLGSHMSFGENRRKKNWRELESTFFMQMLMAR